MCSEFNAGHAWDPRAGKSPPSCDPSADISACHVGWSNKSFNAPRKASTPVTPVNLSIALVLVRIAGSSADQPKLSSNHTRSSECMPHNFRNGKSDDTCQTASSKLACSSTVVKWYGTCRMPTLTHVHRTRQGLIGASGTWSRPSLLLTGYPFLHLLLSRWSL